MIPSDMAPAAQDAQLMAGALFLGVLALLILAAVIAAVLELLNMRNKTKNQHPQIDRTGYLAHLIHCIVSQSPARPAARTVPQPDVDWLAYRLSGGAEIWHDVKGQRLALVRPNGPLQPNEAKTMETHMQKAGYWPGPSVQACMDEGLNTWRGSVWVLVAAESAAQGAGQASQGFLFDQGAAAGGADVDADGASQGLL